MLFYLLPFYKNFPIDSLVKGLKPVATEKNDVQWRDETVLVALFGLFRFL